MGAEYFTSWDLFRLLEKKLKTRTNSKFVLFLVSCVGYVFPVLDSHLQYARCTNLDPNLHYVNLFFNL